VVKKGSVTDCNISGSIPLPSSATVMVKRLAALSSIIVMAISDAPAAMQFCAKSRMCSASSSILVLCQDLLDLIDLQPAVDVLINGDDRGKAARTNAAGHLKGELAVTSGVIYFNPELFF